MPLRNAIAARHSKPLQHRTERAAVLASRWRVHRFSNFLARWKRPVEQEGRGLSATGCGSDLARVTSASSAPMPAPTPSCSPVDSLRTGGREVPYAVPETPRLGCRRRDGIESRLTGLYNGRLTLEIPIATHHRKLRQCAASRAAVGSRLWRAHRLRIQPRLRGKWASRWNVARVLLSWRSGLFYRLH